MIGIFCGGGALGGGYALSMRPGKVGVNEKDDLTAIKKALQTPSEEVAKGLVDQLNAKNIN